MIYFLGRHFKFIRLLYYRKTNRWKWGLNKAIYEVIEKDNGDQTNL